jgi:adenine phosphoribosyltransferase
VDVAADLLAGYVRDILDFPKPGVTFKDITPLLDDHAAFAATIDRLTDAFRGRPVHRVLGIEARGFIVAAPVAYRFGAGFTPVRKAGKLPWHVASEPYELEYGRDNLEIHTDALQPGERAVIVDDVLATGGTAAAAVRLLEGLGAVVVGLGFLLELGFLGGRSQLGERNVVSLVEYE